MTEARTDEQESETLKRRIAELESALATTTSVLATTTSQLESTTSKLESTTAERDKLRRAYDRLSEELELLRRRIFLAKAERVDTTQLELQFAAVKRELEALGIQDEHNDESESEGDDKPPPRKPKGRRDLRKMQVIREDRVELVDEDFEALVAAGRAEHLGFAESCRLSYLRGGAIRVVVARAKYKIVLSGEDTFTTVPRPKELLRRSLLAPAALAHILIAKYAMGLPLYRIETWFKKDGLDLDRGAMSRWCEDAGATLGIIVQAMAKDAMRATCLATDATGVSIQPEPRADHSRQPCKKGHFFVVMADRDHVFFEFQPRHTSAAVCDMFRGYSGFIQADASAIYDSLHRGDAVASGADPPTEVACWSHARRGFWETAICKEPLGLEALFRIRAIFERDATLDKLPPDKRRLRRQESVKPLVDNFFDWVRMHHSTAKLARSRLASALGYALRQEQALRVFLDNGRLEMTNNRSEGALRPIAAGRKAWLFFGSDDHAAAAANLYSLIASCRLHDLDAEAYLRDVCRVLPWWPVERVLELAPKFWLATRARLDPVALEREVGPIAVPPAP
jgi:transposase